MYSLECYVPIILIILCNIINFYIIYKLMINFSIIKINPLMFIPFFLAFFFLNKPYQGFQCLSAWMLDVYILIYWFNHINSRPNLFSHFFPFNVDFLAKQMFFEKLRGPQNLDQWSLLGSLDLNKSKWFYFYISYLF